MKKILIISLGAFISLAAFFPFMTFAGYNGGGDVIIGVRADVSKDDSTWYDYTGDTVSGGQTLTARPGDTITFRGKSWNQSSTTAFPVPIFHASITNSQYLDTSGGFYNDNLDGNSAYYVGAIGTDIMLSSGALPINGNENNAESGTFKVRIKDNTPDQTLIVGTWELSGQGLIGEKSPVQLLPIAKAQALADSTVRILVSNPQVASLAPTGSNVYNLLILPIAVTILGAGLFLRKKIY